MKVRFWRACAIFAIAPAFLAACGGDDPSPEPSTPAVVTKSCEELRTMTVAASDITLPTSGAKVVAAVVQAASGAGAAATPEFCRVSVQIAPVDPTAPPINAQVNLPVHWNQKALQLGGGGFDGVLVTGEGPVPGAAGQPTPLVAGYATFGSDAGHQVSDALASNEHVQAFLNDEAVTNFAYAQIKKTRDVAVALIRARYGALPKRTYYAGGSGGGRSALLAIQRFPDDYDGAISYFPAAGGVPLLMNFGVLSRALAAPGAFPGPAKQQLVQSAVLAACDALDGATDGLISNPSACHFDPVVLRCPSGGDEGNSCLSDAQIVALNVANSGATFSYTLASGETGMPGIPVYSGADISAIALGLGLSTPTAFPTVPMNSVHNLLYDIYYRGMLARNPGADSLAFDPLNPGVYQQRASFLSALTAANNADLTAFQKRGGKLLLVHGTADGLIPIGWSTDYYQKIVAKMGASVTDGFARYFQIPGYGHGTGAFTMDWNSLAALDDWVENGKAVDAGVMTDLNPANALRTRPLCKFPSWAKYSGSGDINSAASYTCVKA